MLTYISQKRQSVHLCVEISIIDELEVKQIFITSALGHLLLICYGKFLGQVGELSFKALHIFIDCSLI